MFRWFLGYKYVFRLITLAALLGVAYSVTVLIVVVSVMEGFRSELESRIRGTTSDIRVESRRFMNLKDPDRVIELVKTVPGVRSASPVVETLGLYRRDESETTSDRIVIALDIENETSAHKLDSYLDAVTATNVEGPLRPLIQEMIDALPKDTKTMFSDEWLNERLWTDERLSIFRQFVRPPKPEERCLPAIVGLESLRQESLLPGSFFELTSFSPIPPHEPRTRKFFVAGYFKTGLYELDAKGIILRLEDCDSFLQLTGDDGQLRVSAVTVEVDDGDKDEDSLVAMRETMEKKLDENDVLFVKVQTWRQAKQPLLEAVRMEKILVSIILGVVILFAGFMIFIILTVQVVERSRDIGVLLSLGSTPNGIATIYFLIGFSLCLVGTCLGTAYGIAFSASINTVQHWIKLATGYEVFPQDVYYLDYIPVRFHPSDLFFIIIPTVAASLIAAIVPAVRAAKKDPAVSLRYE